MLDGPGTACWMVFTTIFCDKCWTNVTPIQLQTELVSSKLVLISNFNAFEVKRILPGKWCQKIDRWQQKLIFDFWFNNWPVKVK